MSGLRTCEPIPPVDNFPVGSTAYILGRPVCIVSTRERRQHPDAGINLPMDTAVPAMIKISFWTRNDALESMELRGEMIRALSISPNKPLT